MATKLTKIATKTIPTSTVPSPGAATVVDVAWVLFQLDIAWTAGGGHQWRIPGGLRDVAYTYEYTRVAHSENAETIFPATKEGSAWSIFAPIDASGFFLVTITFDIDVDQPELVTLFLTDLVAELNRGEVNQAQMFTSRSTVTPDPSLTAICQTYLSDTDGIFLTAGPVGGNVYYEGTDHPTATVRVSITKLNDSGYIGNLPSILSD